MRAAAVCRIARFPIIRSVAGEHAWTLGKAAYERAGALWSTPNVAVDIPFSGADPASGDRAQDIQAYLRVPRSEPPASGWPVLLFICGLDAYRTDNTPRIDLADGFAVLAFEIPGTGDCPASPNDPASSDRLMTSVLDWIDSQANARSFDTSRICARGISTGGYHAFRLAHTHAERMCAVVAQGGGAHYMFNPDWIDAQNQMEYPFALTQALAWKYGYRNLNPQDAVADYKAGAGKFSLLDAGILQQPSRPLLSVNGTQDSIFPIEDSLLVTVTGTRRSITALAERGHMGNPGGEDAVYAWLRTQIKL